MIRRPLLAIAATALLISPAPVAPPNIVVIPRSGTVSFKVAEPAVLARGR